MKLRAVLAHRMDKQALVEQLKPVRPVLPGPRQRIAEHRVAAKALIRGPKLRADVVVEDIKSLRGSNLRRKPRPETNFIGDGRQNSRGQRMR